MYTSHQEPKSCYCAVAFSGRVDRVFQVLLEQEENIIVADMLSDGILVVELDGPPEDEEESTYVCFASVSGIAMMFIITDWIRLYQVVINVAENHHMV